VLVARSYQQYHEKSNRACDCSPISTIKNANRIVVLNEGKIAEVGNHEQLTEQRGIYTDFTNCNSPDEFVRQSRRTSLTKKN